MHGAGLPELPQDGLRLRAAGAAQLVRQQDTGGPSGGGPGLASKRLGSGRTAWGPPPGSLVVLIPGASREVRGVWTPV